MRDLLQISGTRVRSAMNIRPIILTFANVSLKSIFIEISRNVLLGRDKVKITRV